MTAVAGSPSIRNSPSGGTRQELAAGAKQLTINALLRLSPLVFSLRISPDQTRQVYQLGSLAAGYCPV